MDHSTAPPINKRNTISSFFNKLAFFNQEKNDGPLSDASQQRFHDYASFDEFAAHDTMKDVSAVHVKKRTSAVDDDGARSWSIGRIVIIALIGLVVIGGTGAAIKYYSTVPSSDQENEIMKNGTLEKEVIEHASKTEETKLLAHGTNAQLDDGKKEPEAFQKKETKKKDGVSHDGKKAPKVNQEENLLLQKKEKKKKDGVTHDQKKATKVKVSLGPILSTSNEDEYVGEYVFFEETKQGRSTILHYKKVGNADCILSCVKDSDQDECEIKLEPNPDQTLRIRKYNQKYKSKNERTAYFYDNIKGERIGGSDFKIIIEYIYM